MKKTDKLTKKQVLAIPKLLEKKSMTRLAKDYSVTFQAIYYWVRQLRKKGIEVKTRKQGHKSLLE